MFLLCLQKLRAADFHARNGEWLTCGSWQEVPEATKSAKQQELEVFTTGSTAS